MIVTSQNDIRFNELVSELIATTPEWWKEALLELSFTDPRLEDSCTHIISSEKYPHDIVVATDDLMKVTRDLQLRFIKSGSVLKHVNVKILEDVNAKWHFECHIQYFDSSQ